MAWASNHAPGTLRCIPRTEEIKRHTGVIDESVESSELGADVFRGVFDRVVGFEVDLKGVELALAVCEFTLNGTNGAVDFGWRSSAYDDAVGLRGVAERADDLETDSGVRAGDEDDFGSHCI